MKNTIGLIFLFAVINGTLCSPLRELEFIGGLYPKVIPERLLTSIVARRIDQIKALYGSESIKDGKTFYNSTEQSLELLMKLMNDTPSSDAIKYYSGVVELVENKKQSFDVDYASVNSLTSPRRDELQTLIDAYIDDIEMVIEYEASLAGSDGVDMEIVGLIKSLSNDLRNLIVYGDGSHPSVKEDLTRRAMNQFLLQLRFLLEQFTKRFVSHSRFI